MVIAASAWPHWASAAPNPNLNGDLNSDNRVDVLDLSFLLGKYATNNFEADINGDGPVDITDLSILLTYYGKTYIPDGVVLFNGDADSGFGVWCSIYRAAADRITTVTSPSIDGLAYKFQVRDGDNISGERSELGTTGAACSSAHAFEGDERWYGFSVYLPDDFVTDARWSDVTQWKEDGTGGNQSPPLDVQVMNNRIGLTHHSASKVATNLWYAPATKNVWHNFVVRIKYSPVSSIGFIELYYSADGSEPKPAMPRRYVSTLLYEGDYIKPRIGYYRDASIATTTTLYVDKYKIGTSFDAVRPR